MPIYANYSAIFRQRECENHFSPIIRKSETFENSLIPRYKLKIKIGFIFDRGRFFGILLDFSVHLLLKVNINGFISVKLNVFTDELTHISLFFSEADKIRVMRVSLSAAFRTGENPFTKTKQFNLFAFQTYTVADSKKTSF